MHHARRLSTVLISLLLVSTARPALAINYDVEIIIFEHVRSTFVGASDTFMLPVIPDARPIPETVDPLKPIQALPEKRLLDHAEKIRQSPDHRLLYHGGWRQPDYSVEEAPYMRIELGAQVPMFVEQNIEEDAAYRRAYAELPLNSNARFQRANSRKLYGGIKVWVGRFLHFDTLLAYTPTGAVRSFEITTDHRMRSRQLHYIDNTRIGILTKIFPVDESAPN